MSFTAKPRGSLYFVGGSSDFFNIVPRGLCRCYYVLWSMLVNILKPRKCSSIYVSWRSEVFWLNYLVTPSPWTFKNVNAVMQVLIAWQVFKLHFVRFQAHCLSNMPPNILFFTTKKHDLWFLFLDHSSSNQCFSHRIVQNKSFTGTKIINIEVQFWSLIHENVRTKMHKNSPLVFSVSFSPSCRISFFFIYLYSLS